MRDLDHQRFATDAMIDDVWIVIAAFNEAAMIARTLAELCPVYRNVVVVSDGSTDQTIQQAIAGGAVVLSHAINLGQGAALQTGIDYALSRGAKFVCTFDADGQHRVCDIAVLLEQLKKEKADIAFGSRFLGGSIGMPMLRKVVLKLGAIFNFLTTGILMTDAHNGLRVMTADTARRIRIRQNGMAHASEMVEQVARLKLKFVEVPVVVIYSQYSKAKGQRLGNSVNIALDVIGRKVQR